jgi:metal-responsive CopG/Arc/MetJ family transcriptional regulator
MIARIAIVATRNVAPIGIGLTTELLQLIDAERGDLSRSLFVRRIIQDYYQPTEQHKKSITQGLTRFVSVAQKPATKVVRNQTMSKIKK